MPLDDADLERGVSGAGWTDVCMSMPLSSAQTMNAMSAAWSMSSSATPCLRAD
ncbi:MAG: hypothetical protein FWF28_01780 [Micrococcales bacterium]|nr:hypothetical protein [Micrococcales bacterium]